MRSQYSSSHLPRYLPMSSTGEGGLDLGSLNVGRQLDHKRMASQESR